MRLLTSQRLEGFDRVLRKFPLWPLIVLSFLFILTGHYFVYRNLDFLLYAWSPKVVSPFAGIVYILLVLASVLIHESGHLLSYVRRGNYSAEIHITLNSYWPSFFTKSIIDQEVSESSLYPLSGVYFQLLFASTLGFVLLQTDLSGLKPAILLIDMAVLVSIVPTPGTDGFLFFMSLLQVHDVKRDYWQTMEGTGTRISIESAAARGATIWTWLSAFMGISLFLLYLVASISLFGLVLYQFFTTATWSKISLTDYRALWSIFYVLLLVPPCVFLSWALLRVPFALRFVLRFFKVFKTIMMKNRDR